MLSLAAPSFHVKGFLDNANDDEQQQQQQQQQDRKETKESKDFDSKDPSSSSSSSSPSSSSLLLDAEQLKTKTGWKNIQWKVLEKLIYTAKKFNGTSASSAVCSCVSFHSVFALSLLLLLLLSSLCVFCW
jgi:hypothetical protein